MNNQRLIVLGKFIDKKLMFQSLYSDSSRNFAIINNGNTVKLTYEIILDENQIASLSMTEYYYYYLLPRFTQILQSHEKNLIVTQGSVESILRTHAFPRSFLRGCNARFFYCPPFEELTELEQMDYITKGYLWSKREYPQAEILTYEQWIETAKSLI